MSRFLAAAVTVIDGKIRARVDPELGGRTAAVKLAVRVALARQERTGAAGGGQDEGRSS